MDRKEPLPMVRVNDPIISSKRIYFDYRIHMCRHVNRLLDGDRHAWEEFQNLRSALKRSKHLAKWFSWEDPFLKEPWPHDLQPPHREFLCKRIRISLRTLKSYEKMGFLPEAPGSSPYALHHVKRLQWILFFLKELRINTPGLLAMLDNGHLFTRLEVLACSAPPHLPIHRSPPSQQPQKRVTYREGLQTDDDQGTRDLLHDMGNRIHIIAGRANLLKRKMGDHELSERNLSIILAQTQKAEILLKALMSRVRRTSGNA